MIMETGALPGQPAQQPHLVVLAVLQPVIPAVILVIRFL